MLNKDGMYIYIMKIPIIIENNKAIPARDNILTIEFWHFMQLLSPNAAYPHSQILHKGPI